MKEKLKTVYVCTSCGEVAPRWLGRCPACGEWNTLMEDVVSDERVGKSWQKTKGAGPRVPVAEAVPLAQVNTTEPQSRIVTGIGELDRVLGGGIVLGSVVLLGGEPGAGKSTMLLQLSGAIGGRHSVLYITGEESVRQIKLRSVRLGIAEDNIVVAAESDMDEIEGLITRDKPGFVVVDSVQTMHAPSLASAPGSVSQVKECAARLLGMAKKYDIPIFIVGHVNKDGAIAGPKVMEHIVDTVLYFEGDRTLPYKILRAVKNRYGSTNEIGMFDMTNSGLLAIENPSELLLEGRPVGVSGNCVGCIMEGTRPIMADIQALATKSSFGTPRRATAGFDTARANVIMAVLEKREGYFLGNLDIYINVVGGLSLNETACDLAVCMALVSSLLNRPLDDKTLVIGEIGLGGEVRGVANLDMRLREAQRIGFTQAVVPLHSMKALDLKEFNTMHIEGVRYIRNAIAALLPAPPEAGKARQ